MNHLIALLTLLLINCGKPTSSVVLNKCCEINQQFNDDDVCEDLSSDDVQTNSGDQLWWVPKNKLLQTNSSTNTNQSMSFKYGQTPNCKESEQDILYYLTDSDEFDLVQENKQIHLKVLREDTVYESKTGGITLFPSSSYCIDKTVYDTFAVILCPCSVNVRCARKCCFDTFKLINDPNKTCESVDDSMEESKKTWRPKIDDDSKSFYRLHNKPPSCPKNGPQTVMPMSSTLDGFQSMLLLLDGDRIQDLDSNVIYSADEYCGDLSFDNIEHIFFCIRPNEETYIIEIVYGVFFIIGAIALFLTVLLTILMPDMRKNIHGKMAFCHNLALLVAYTTNGVILMSPVHAFSKTACICISFIIQFSMLASFFWLNVMCMDVAWVFSTLRPIRGISTQTTNMKFLFYSLYAWGSASAITIITAIVEFIPGASLKPQFGVAMCFFNDWHSQLLFYYGPMAVLLIINLALFVFTITKIVLAKRGSSVLNANDSEAAKRKKREALILYTKLFILMGVTWIFEVISWGVGGRGAYWVFTDIVNLLRGVFIFIVFCCKLSVYEPVRDKVLRMCGMSAGETTRAVPSGGTKSTGFEETKPSTIQLAERRKTDSYK